MRFKTDHDLHIHSFLSLCANNDTEQNKYNIFINPHNIYFYI